MKREIQFIHHSTPRQDEKRKSERKPKEINFPEKLSTQQGDENRQNEKKKYMTKEKRTRGIKRKED